MTKKGGYSMNFKVMRQADVPLGRKGKHNAIVARILSDLDQLGEGAALKIPLDGLIDGKEKVRSALNRAMKKHRRIVLTASDDTFLYVWNEKSRSGTEGR
jgi:hypothetical protein